VNWPTTLCENKDGVHFFTLGFEFHNRYNKLLLCDSQNGDIAWCNKNSSEQGFCVFFWKIIKTCFFSKKTKTNGFKKNKQPMWIVFFQNPFFFNPDYLQILFCDFPLIARSGTIVTSLSVWLGVRRIPKVYDPGIEKAENYWYLNT